MSTPRCIARDIFAQVASSIGDSGVCATNPQGKAKILFTIDLAQSALVKRVDTEGLLWDFPVQCAKGCFAIPEDCESDRNIFVNGFPAIQRDQWYEGKLAWGRNNVGNDCQMQCIDEGQFPIPLPLPKAHGIRIALVAEAAGDAGKTVDLEIVNPYGTRIQESLTLKADGLPAVSHTIAYDVTLVNKPETLGSILLQLHYDNGQRFFHARYGPKTRQGYFRRKKLPQQFWGCNAVVIKGKLRTYPITKETDILPFTDIHAWRWAAQAIDAQDRGELDNYERNLAAAIRELSRSMQDSDPAGNRAQIRFATGFGSNPSQGANRKMWA